MHLGGAGVEQHLHDLPRRRAAHDRVVDDDEALAGDLGERVELHPDPLLAHALLGLDERAADVAVLDQPLAERDPGRAREADRRGRARVGDRQDEVGLDRRLVRRAARPSARARRAPRRPRAACRAARGRRTRRCRARRARRGSSAWTDCEPVSSATTSSPGRISRSNSAPTRSSAQRLRRDHRVVAEAAEDERPEAVGVAEREQPRRRRARPRWPRPRGAPSPPASASIERTLVVGDQRGDHLGVGGRGERLAERRAQLVGVDEVAVVAERHGARAAVMERAAASSPRRSRRSSSSACVRSRARLRGREAALVEHLRDEAEVAQRGQPAVLAHRDPGRLLAAVLQRIEAEVREPRDVAARRANAEDPAHLGHHAQLDEVVPAGPRSPAATATIAPARPRRLEVSAPIPDQRRRLAQREGDAAVRHVVGEREEVRRAATGTRRARGRSRARGARGRRAATGRGCSVTSRTSPTQPTTGVGGIGLPPVSL